MASAQKRRKRLLHSITSFALYGFPESHAASFALIAYASAYLKCHYLAAFTAALLNNQPMGFYSAATIVKDAQRHGLKVKPVDVLRSEWLCTLEPENSLEERLPSLPEEGMQGQRPRRGWLVREHPCCGSEPRNLSNHPGSSRWLLPTPPYPRRGVQTPFHLTSRRTEACWAKTKFSPQLRKG